MGLLLLKLKRNISYRPISGVTDSLTSLTDPVAIGSSKAEKDEMDEPAEFFLCYSAN